MSKAPSGYVLHVLAGPPAGPFVLTPDALVTLGRSMECVVCLPHESVSRRHAQMVFREGRWCITDTGSAAGTFVGATRLLPHQPTPIDVGDLLRIGPWTLHLSSTGTNARGARTIDDTGTGTHRIETVARGGSIAASRLALLTEGIEAMHLGGDEHQLAAAALRAALRGTACPRGAVLRTIDHGGEIQMLASVDPSGGAMTFSRSLIQAASEGRVVMLTEHDQPVSSVSIVQANIQAAICAPIHIGEAIVGYLYLDTRSKDELVRQDAGAFCEAVARALGLALANRQRSELAHRQAQLASELHAAREVQQFIMPEPEGAFDFVRYAMHSHAGAMVAGDLFDAVPLGDGRVCFAIGDVSGHGAGSAMLMAAVQAQLSAHLSHTNDLASAIASVNAYLCTHELAGRFVSLAAIAVAPDGWCDLVDAGHGYWLTPGRDEDSGHHASRGIPLGIDPGAGFAAARFRLNSGDRFVLYSDGVVDERGADGTPFGLGALRAALMSSSDPASDVQAVFDGLRAHSGLDGAGDDCTVASIQYIVQ